MQGDVRRRFQSRDAVGAFVENAIFAPARRHETHPTPGSCNGQPALATYEPGDDDHLVVTGLQVLQLGDLNGQPMVTALVSYRDPALAIRCGLPCHAASHASEMTSHGLPAGLTGNRREEGQRLIHLAPGQSSLSVLIAVPRTSSRTPSWRSIPSSRRRSRPRAR
jgi:hypothetical protein